MRVLMRAFFIALLLTASLIAFAQTNPNFALLNEIQVMLPSGTGAVTAANLRRVLTDIVNTIQFATQPPGTSNNTAASTAFVQQNAFPTVSVLAYGALCNGSNDDTLAIQAAINALPNDGGIVVFPNAQTCNITSSLNLGNGTTTTFSTKRGIVLRGAGLPNAPAGFFTGGYPVPTGPKLTWAGSNGNMINVNGPLMGWGVQNLYIDCQSVAGTAGINVVSAQNGDSKNLTIANCTSAGIKSGSNPIGGYAGANNVDSLHNDWLNTNILVPAVAGAFGIFVNGATDGTSDTDYNTFTNTFIRFAGNAANFGLYLAVADSNVFNNLNISGGGASTTNIQLDYTVNSTFPLGNVIVGLDPGPASISIPFATGGSPATGSRPNYLYGLQESNGGVNPTVAGWYSSLPVTVAPTVSLAGQSAAIGITGFYTNPNIANTYRINYYLMVTTTDVGAATITPKILWQDPTGTVQTLSGTAAADNTLGQLSQGSFIARVGAGQSINYQTTISASLGNARYSLFVTVEKIQ